MSLMAHKQIKILHILSEKLKKGDMKWGHEGSPVHTYHETYYRQFHTYI
jgi:hypothetical protein